MCTHDISVSEIPHCQKFPAAECYTVKPGHDDTHYSCPSTSSTTPPGKSTSSLLVQSPLLWEWPERSYEDYVIQQPGSCIITGLGFNHCCPQQISSSQVSMLAEKDNSVYGNDLNEGAIKEEPLGGDRTVVSGVEDEEWDEEWDGEWNEEWDDELYIQERRPHPIKLYAPTSANSYNRSAALSSEAPPLIRPAALGQYAQITCELTDDFYLEPRQLARMNTRDADVMLGGEPTDVNAAIDKFSGLYVGASSYHGMESSMGQEMRYAATESRGGRGATFLKVN